jgi:hypothetical protein
LRGCDGGIPVWCNFGDVGTELTSQEKYHGP